MAVLVTMLFCKEKKKRKVANESIDPDADYREDEPEIELPLDYPEDEKNEETVRHTRPAMGNRSRA